LKESVKMFNLKRTEVLKIYNSADEIKRRLRLLNNSKEKFSLLNFQLELIVRFGAKNTFSLGREEEHISSIKLLGKIHENKEFSMVELEIESEEKFLAIVLLILGLVMFFATNEIKPITEYLFIGLSSILAYLIILYSVRIRENQYVKELEELLNFGIEDKQI